MMKQWKTSAYVILGLVLALLGMGIWRIKLQANLASQAHYGELAQSFALLEENQDYRLVQTGDSFYLDLPIQMGQTEFGYSNLGGWLTDQVSDGLVVDGPAIPIFPFVDKDTQWSFSRYEVEVPEKVVGTWNFTSHYLPNVKTNDWQSGVRVTIERSQEGAKPKIVVEEILKE